MNFIDLHIHTTFSDGTVSPDRLLQIVHPEQYDHVVLALTDHDGTAGFPDLKASAAAYSNVDVIPGVEVSTEYLGYAVHMLGYGIDPDDEEFNRALALLRDGRDNRNVKIAELIRKQGIPIPDEVVMPHDGQTIGRPLIARWMMEHGYVESIREAFVRYLAEGACCYVPRISYTPAETVRMILRAGGIPVLAHPMQYRKFTREQLETMIGECREAGLVGIETYYTEFSPDEIRYVESLSDRFGLIRTGGSDFHGDNKPNYRLGFGWESNDLRQYFEKINYRFVLEHMSKSGTI